MKPSALTSGLVQPARSADVLTTEHIATTEEAKATPVDSEPSAGARLARRWFADAAPFFILVTLIAYFGVRSDRFASLGNVRVMMDQSAIPLVAAVGMTLVILMGSIDLSTEGVMAASSIATALLVVNTVNDRDWAWAGVAVGIGIGALFGLFSGAVHTQLRMPSVMVTIGTWFIGLGLAASWFPDRPPSVSDVGLRSLALDRWFGVSLLAYVALLVAVLAAIVLRYTTFGRGIYAIGGDEALTRLAGVPVRRYRIVAFTVAGTCAGLAGVLSVSRTGIGSVQAGQGVLFTTISSVVIGGTSLQGGRGGIGHTIVGVAILTVLANGMVLTGVDPSIQQAIEGAIIIVAVVASGWRRRQRLRVVK